MNDVELIKRFQLSPIFFIETMWGLVPQPVKAEYVGTVEGLVESGRQSELKPVYFENFIRGKHITWQQWKFLISVERAIQKKDKQKISIVSGHGTGKSSSLSWVIIWYLFCFEDSQIGATAPTSEQIHDVLWKELALWLGKLPSDIKDVFEWSAGYVRVKERPETWWARARTARKEAPEAIAGLHGEHVLVVADEAAGIPDEIYRAAEGSLTGANTLVILISNGTRTQGYFYDTHHGDSNNWQVLSFNSEDSPIVEEGYILRMIEKYGRESDEFKIRVSGGFPSSEQMDDAGWIPLISDKQIIQVSGSPFVGKKWLGIDPSGEGDDTTRWVLRDRFQARVVATEATSNDKGIARKTYQLIKENELDPNNVIVGNFGTGADVRAELLLLDHNMDIRTVNEGDKANDYEVYINRRAEMCFRGRTWLIRGGGIEGDELKRDITGFLYKNDRKGRKQILDKPSLKKRLGRSPDRGDAFFMTFAEDVALDTHSNETIKVDNVPTTNDPYAAI